MKKFYFYPLANQRGYLLIVAAIMIVIVGFIGAAVSSMFFSSSMATASHYQSDQALYLAESGLEHATHKLLEPTIADRLTCVGYNTTALANTLGAGSYSVISSGSPTFPTATTLSAALTANTTSSIPVVSTTGYANSGRVMIDYEFINYASISAASFNNVTRGVDGTTAAAHVSGAPVGQYQCNLTSLGGVPNLISPLGKRSLTDNVQLQEVWAVGALSGGDFSLEHWNRPTEKTWTDASLTSGSKVNLTSISMISYADGWAVGASNNFLHWNGSAWSVVASGLNNTTYSGVYCNASNYCYVVGTTKRIGYWNGTAWSAISPTGASTNLLSVYCDSGTDCWAVGDNKAPTTFYHGTGGPPVTWTAVVVALSAGAYPFNSVFCNTGGTDCWAVGKTNIFAHYTAGAWGSDTVAQQGTAPNKQFNSVFCNSTSDCWAVGDLNGADVNIVHWNGAAWSLDTSNPVPAVNLATIDCANTNDCWAAGAAAGGQPVFDHWDGTAWTNFAVAGLPNVAMTSISIVSPNSLPLSGWSENFP